MTPSTAGDTRTGDKFVTVLIDLTPVHDDTGPAWLQHERLDKLFAKDGHTGVELISCTHQATIPAYRGPTGSARTLL